MPIEIVKRGTGSVAEGAGFDPTGRLSLAGRVVEGFLRGVDWGRVVGDDRIGEFVESVESRGPGRAYLRGIPGYALEATVDTGDLASMLQYCIDHAPAESVNEKLCRAAIVEVVGSGESASLDAAEGIVRDVLSHGSVVWRVDEQGGMMGKGSYMMGDDPYAEYLKMLRTSLTGDPEKSAMVGDYGDGHTAMRGYGMMGGKMGESRLVAALREGADLEAGIIRARGFVEQDEPDADDMPKGDYPMKGKMMKGMKGDYPMKGKKKGDYPMKGKAETRMIPPGGSAFVEGAKLAGAVLALSESKGGSGRDESRVGEG